MTDFAAGPNLGSPAASRRRVLSSLATAGTLTLAGCLDQGESSDDSDDGPEELAEEIEEERQLNGVVLSSSFPIQLFEPGTDDRVAEVHYHAEFSHWHFMPFEIPLNGWRPVEARFFNDNNEVIPVGQDERFQLDITRTAETPEDLLELEISQENLVNFHGTSTGEGELLFHLMEGDEQVWTTPPLTVVVQDEDGSA